MINHHDLLKHKICFKCHENFSFQSAFCNKRLQGKRSFGYITLNVSVCIYSLCSCHWFEVGEAQLEKGDVTYILYYTFYLWVFNKI